MTDDTETTDERRIDYEYRAEAPTVPPVGTLPNEGSTSRITGTPELAETVTRSDPIERRMLSDGGRGEANR